MEPVIQIGLIVLIFMFVLVLWWMRSKLLLDQKNCTTMNNLYTDFPLVRTINFFNDDFAYSLRDFYIKTAYNCCAAGTYKNDFVNICALKDCIKQGVRCLDFAIYSIDGVAAIAISTTNDYTVKQSYNSVPFALAMNVIKDYAFSGSTCPNPGDPLLLHFRIMSNNTKIYDAMAQILNSTLGNRLLDSNYSFEYHGQNIASSPLRDLMGKIIVIVDKTNPLFLGTKFEEYVNLASNSVFMRMVRYSEVKFSPDITELTFFNKQNMSICLPDLGANNDNPSAQLPMQYGCQMVGMSFQRFDGNLEYYTKQFDDAGSAFILKPKDLRYIPLLIDKAKPVPASHSYAIQKFEAFPGAPGKLAALKI